MALINNLSENIVLPLFDFLFNRKTFSFLKFLNQSQWWSKGEIENYQNENLRILISHAFNNIEFYNEIFKKHRLKPDDIKTKDDLHKLPVITKKMIKENKKMLTLKNHSGIKYHEISSSGSTGEPLQYLRSNQAYDMSIASSIRGWYWMGYRLGDKFSKFSQNDRDSFMKKLQDIFTFNNYIQIQHLTEETFKIITNQLLKNKPKYLRAYPDPLFFLSKYIEKNNINIDFLKGITTTGNVLHEKNREYIENVFNVNIYDAYSCEGSAVFFQCNYGTYHAADEYAISEFIKIDNSQEAVSNLITTDLWNYTMPLIRYNTQDLLMIQNEKCKCGRFLTPVKKIGGRDNDILITPSNKKLIVHNFTGYFEWKREVEQFQIIQEDIDKIRIHLVVNNDYNKSVENEILKYWQKYIGIDMKVSIKVKDNINLAKSGKRRFLINKYAEKVGYENIN